jgi:hypothetical protein
MLTADRYPLSFCNSVNHLKPNLQKQNYYYSMT